MAEPVETFEVNGKKVSIYQDDSAESPRNDDNLGVMLCWHRRVLLGDEQISPRDLGEDLGEVSGRIREELGKNGGRRSCCPSTSTSTAK